MRQNAYMIWSENGVRLQTYDREGQMRLSDLGKLSLHSVQEFCQARGITLCIRGRNFRASVAHPVPVAVEQVQ